MKNILLFLVVLFSNYILSYSETPEQEILNIAVLEFEARGISKVEADVISDRIRVELQNTNIYNVLEREMMKEILGEQAFQQTGCTDQSCLVEVGRMLAVEKMVGGSISKIGNLWVIEARIIDVETGKIERSVAQDFSGPIELLLANTVKITARKLADLKVEEKQPVTTLTGGTADLVVESEPSGGVIYLDGTLINNPTPYTLTNLPAGEHFIKVEKDNLIAEKQIILEKGRLNRVSLKLEEKTYTLLIYSAPDKAPVRIGNQEIGVTPCEHIFKNGDLPLDVSIEKEGYFPYRQTIEKPGESITRLNIKLKKYGIVNITTNPENAEVFINNESVGFTPYTSDPLPLSDYNIEIRKKYFAPVSKEITLNEENSSITFNAELQQLFGEVDISGFPKGATVYINNSDKGKIPLENMKLPYGIYNIQATMKGFHTFKDEIEIIEPKQSIEISLTPKSRFKAILLSAAFPGSGQIYSGYYLKGTLITSLSAGSLILAYLADQEFQKTWDQYNTNLSLYRQATTLQEIEMRKAAMQQSHEDALKMQKNVQILTGISTILWGYNLLDILVGYSKIKKFSQKQNQQSFVISIKRGDQIEVSYHF